MEAGNVGMVRQTRLDMKSLRAQTHNFAGPTAIRVSAIFLVALLVLAVALTPVVYDTLHVNDTTFMLQVSEWVRSGETPGVDFDYYYGGLQEAFVAIGLNLSGGEAKALDYARLLQFGLVCIAIGIIAWKRFDFTMVVLLVLLSAVILFAVLPFEEYPFISTPEAAHSFTYNRLGTVLALLCAAVLLRPSQTALAEWVGGSIAGFAGIAAIFAKATFFPITLAMVLGLVLMFRWRALIAFVIAFALFVVIFDPTGARTLGTLMYSLQTTDTVATDSWLIIKAIRLVISQQMAVLVFLISIAIVLIAPAGSKSGLSACGAVLLAGAFWATSVTMGPAGLIGHQALPFLAGLVLLLAPDFRDGPARGAGLALIGTLYLSFCGPHILNILGTTYVGYRNAEEVVFKSGPLSGYLARGPWRHYEDGSRISIRSDPDRAVNATAQRLAAGYHDATTDYVLLMNAVTLLDGIHPPEGYGVVSNTTLGIGFAIGAGRVDGFPAWPRSTAPEFADGSDPLRKASVILMQRQDQGALTEKLRSFMGEDFVLCRQSPVWDVFVRDIHRNENCT